MNLTLRIIVPECPVDNRTFENITSLTIGRSDSCELCLPLFYDLSREHAKLELVDGAWTLVDLDSKYGSFVDEHRIDAPTIVDPGSTFRLGDTVQFCLISSSDVRSEPVEHEVAAVAAVRPAPQQDSQDVHADGGEIVAAVAVGLPTDEAFRAAIERDQAAVPAGRLELLPEKRDRTFAWRWHIGLGLFTLLAAVGWLVWYLDVTRLLPSRGYTTFGLIAGIFGTLALGFVGFYAGRKRIFQEWLPWRLLTWLRLHLWLSVLGVWAVLLHAGFNLDGGSGTIAMLLLAATVLTGVGGWYLYKKVPGQVLSSVGNLATTSVRQQIQSCDREVQDQLAGCDRELTARVNAAIENEVLQPNVQLPVPWSDIFSNPSDRPLVEKLKRLVGRRVALGSKLVKQESLKRWLRGWLFVHVPAALLLPVFVLYHVYDATEARWLVDTPGPTDYADPLSCAKCHQSQYDDWIGSMHAIAQSSPVTDLQNRLVVLKDRFDNGRHGVVVGDLCINCHAPTSRLGGSEREKEDILLDLADRSPASQFGVSCVACHQISEIHETRPFAEDKDNVKFKNAENLTFTQGRKMVGPFGETHPSVGNSTHKGQFGAHFNDSSFCASCHTVMVDPKGPDNLVTLQNTFKEWQEGGDKTIDLNWNTLGVACIDCHGKPLDGLVNSARLLQVGRTDLQERVRLFADLVKQNADAPLRADRFAANPPDGFDLPLKERRTHLHTFVGVDYHLEKNLPYPASHPRSVDNAQIQQQTVKEIANLMKVAAAVKIGGVDSGGVNVDVANLATGHHLPAGFAFAREMWLEVSVSSERAGEDFRVIAGGKNGRPISATEKLDKFGEGRQGKLKNFQAVLWNGDEGRQDADGTRHGETVLQNECVKVLKGKAAVEHGFSDRVRFLKPGEVRTLRLAVDRNDLASARRIRVRLRFRNFPPEFLEQLADRYELNDDRYQQSRSQGFAPDQQMWDRDPERSERTRKLINGLRIFEMAQDEVAL